ncbi:Tn3 family transposase [Streptomyces sp. NPDC055966]|uniref:Tn3 family transposase n=1 Tax=Streptomyces sp. NPDC055966 TaxID=3345669 RepID=UPI0035DE9AD6
MVGHLGPPKAFLRVLAFIRHVAGRDGACPRGWGVPALPQGLRESPGTNEADGWTVTALPEALYIMEGLLKNASEVRPGTIHVDTQGQSKPPTRNS